MEREFFASRDGHAYAANGADTATVASAGHPFRTRIVVRRPATAERFNGTVIVEWFNVSNQYDQEVDWLQIARASRARGVRVGRRLGAAPPASTRRPGCGRGTRRYGALDLTDGGTVDDDALSYDMFTQAGKALRARRGPARTVCARSRCWRPATRSRPAGCARTTTRSTRWRGVYDGFVLRGVFGDTTVRTDIRTPVWKLQLGDPTRSRSSGRDAPARHALCAPGRSLAPPTATGS